MNIEDLRTYCLRKIEASEETPFGENTLVFKVLGKMFALTSLDAPQLSVNLKCQPEKAQELRERYPAVQPGYHMNKKHWNTVVIDGSLPDDFIYGLIDHSYDLVVDKLPKTQQKKIRNK